MTIQDWAFTGGFAALVLGLWLVSPAHALIGGGGLVVVLCVAARVRG